MTLRIHQYHSLHAGPRLLVLGAVHGNETCGTKALRQAIDWLDANKASVTRGTLTMIPVTNTKAYAQGTREGDRNLNRRLVSNAAPKDHEDRVGQALLREMAEHDVLLDLHSFRSHGEAFVMLGPRNNDHALEPFSQQHNENALAQALGPTRMVEGWMEIYARYCSLARENGHAEADPDLGVGTTEAMRRLGGYGVTLECGNHLDPATGEVAWNAIWRTLQHLGMLSAPVVSPAPENRVFDVLRLHDVLVRNHQNDHLSRSWNAFEAYENGALLATRHGGHEVRAESDGRIVFPSVEVPVGEEWLYLARASDRFAVQP
jgi:predicted deacylase